MWSNRALQRTAHQAFTAAVAELSPLAVIAHSP
jgi:hypothetical protein